MKGNPILPLLVEVFFRIFEFVPVLIGENNKLISSVTEDLSAAGKAFPPNRGKVDKDLISFTMPIAVIDGFEIIDINPDYLSICVPMR